MSGQANRAFIVAVSDYPAGSGWMKIHADNDPQLIVPLLERLGYLPVNITVLKNEQATFKAVTSGLEEFARKTGRGDHVYIHFSCHGQQMTDDNGDEEDGLDEALIPYNAPRRYEKGVYEGENHIRDDMMEILLDKIRAKAGSDGNVVVVFDACHSGTAHREPGDGYVRGTAYIFGPVQVPALDFASSAIKLQMNSSRSLAPMTVFSACQPDELNYEYREETDGKYYGSLTYAFVKVLARGERLTNAEFYEKLCKQMSEMFAGRKRKQTPYYETTHETKRFTISR